MTHYIFGYGSLMNSESRRLTGQTSGGIPAVVNGLVRYWSKVDDSYVISPLIVNKGDGQVNGVLVKVEEEALSDFDTRERSYQRVELSLDDIEVETPLNSDSKVWVYVTDSPEPPCSISPIVQTYVDTVLAGCLEVSPEFAKSFVQQTVGWHFPLENDRERPKYGNRVDIPKQIQQQIDGLIHDVKVGELS